MLRGVVLLPGKAAPDGIDHARAQLGRQLDCSIVRAAVDHYDLVAAAQALHNSCDVALLVVGDDRGRDLHSGAVDSLTRPTELPSENPPRPVPSCRVEL